MFGLFILSGKLLFAQTESDTMACAHNTCFCSNDNAPSGVMISHVHEKNQWMFSYRFMNMNMSDVMSGTKDKAQSEVFLNYLMAPQSMKMNMHMLMAMYGITNHFTVMAMFNYFSNSMDMAMFSNSTHQHNSSSISTVSSTAMNMKSSGLSDVKLHLLYGLLDKNNHKLLFSLGLNLPLGSIQKTGNADDMAYPNSRLPYMMQLGSGTFDLMPCLNYLFQYNDLTASAQFSSVLRTNTNSIGYHYGNEFALNTWMAYSWHQNISSSVRAEGLLGQTISGQDNTVYYYNEPSANPNNYGGEKVNLFVGSKYQFQNNFLKNNQLSLEYGLPIYQNLNGLQLKTQQLFNVAWNYKF